ncbi:MULTISPECIES: GNAT family N-acetyltransferase [Pseudoalteromonas]|jgi:phosphinothricin acetyltransferase|uniref:N-acetyltransferase n=2 Tax=Pseudoalteromonas aliena TaxID=247523 RepID=A0A1Q2GVW1_9GAMM|nr:MULTISPECIES: GNAT family N-acetyltransferase [Pseudoalteromonas]AQP99268.1 N-acetyltransferase [Pseudoalteromonas aliena]MBE0360747.1 phosphinothricin acetyltransferase [Pseudoalteromonas aliena SW19]TMN99917.1 N-acetyltransferase [Pseudoalteromonas sp. S558]
MTTRLANINDLSDIVAIYNETIAGRMVTADTENVTVAEKRDWFNSHTAERPIYVYCENNQVLAWLSYKSFYGRPAYDGTVEMSIYITAKAQGKGLGKKLMNFAQTQAKQLNIKVLLGFIFSHNLPSVKLFKHFNFAVWGELPNVAIMDGKLYSLTIFGKHLQ